MTRHCCPVCSFANDRIHAIASQATALARAIIEERLRDIEAVILGATSFDAAAAGLLSLAAEPLDADFSTLIRSALELGALEGREAVFLDMDEEELLQLGAIPPASFADRENPIEQSFTLQGDFLRQKRPMPTRAWQDAMQGDHDRSFVIAGATNIAMLEEFQTAIVEASRTYDYDSFALEFDRLVEKYGWSYKGGREWRIRTIFETNLRTSHMAGRLAQMRDPDVVALMPWWQYIHGESRTPMQPRPMHLSWDGLLVRWDDPWWEIHFPPNDWMCSCGVRAMSERRARQQPRWGQPAPKDMMRGVLDRANQRTVQVPQGIGLGWDYQPGKLWERGLVPSKLEAEAGGLIPDARQSVRIDPPAPLPELLSDARPFQAAPLALNLSEESYVQAFLDVFGAGIDKAVAWQDPTGTVLPVSADLFREAGSGAWNIGRREQAALSPLLAETLRDPDEIWMGLARKIDLQTGAEQLVVDRRYIRTDGNTGLVVAFEIGRKWWQGLTAYAPQSANPRPDFSAFQQRRGGKLLWSLKTKRPG